jgi:hypothetical protein
MPTNFVEVEKSKNTAWIPLAGFITLMILAAVAYLLAPAVQEWLQTTSWVAGSTKVLPIRFPGNWSPLVVRLAVALGVWMPMFAVLMVGLFMVMGAPMGETDVSLKEIRAEKKEMSGGRRRR